MKSYSHGYYIKNEQTSIFIVGYVSKNARTPIGIPYYYKTVVYDEMTPGFTQTTHKKDLTKKA